MCTSGILCHINGNVLDICCIREERIPFFFFFLEVSGLTMRPRSHFFLRSFQRKPDRWASNILCSSAQTWVPLLPSPPQVCQDPLPALYLKHWSLTPVLSFSSPSFLPPPPTPFVPVELVKAADIKVIAALGDSLTVPTNVLVLQLCGLDHYH